MCVAIICPPGIRPDKPTLNACNDANPHGIGVAWREAGVVKYFKTFDLGEIVALLPELDGEIVVHFRLASIGGVNEKLIHPFPITHKSELRPSGRARAVLFQNGTWIDFDAVLTASEKYGVTIPVGPMSDSRAAATLVSHFGKSVLKQAACGSRWVLFGHKRTSRVGKWQERDGMLFSNLYWARRLFAPEPRETDYASNLGKTNLRNLAGEYWDMVEGRG